MTGKAIDPSDLIGKPESYRLEFKAAKTLESPVKIGRGVVAFLNAGGGDLWVGIEEREGRAIAAERIPRVENALRSLQDHLIDTIEPSPRIPEEVNLSPIGNLIRISVRKGRRGPYTQVNQGRRFWLRIGDRTREMSHDEIRTAFADETGKEDAGTTKLAGVIEQIRRDQEKELSGEPHLWMRLDPVEPLSIDLDDEETRQRFRSWLTDPATTGNRKNGWTFVRRLQEAHFRPDRIEHGKSERHEVKVTRGGQITFRVSRDRLFRPDVEKDPNYLWSYAVMEFPTSVFRLAGKIFGQYDAEPNLQKVVAALAITGLRGWKLRAGSPRDPFYPTEDPHTFEEDALCTHPLPLGGREIIEEPDRCAFRLVRLIYDKFDFDADAIPEEFEPTKGLRLPE